MTRQYFYYIFQEFCLFLCALHRGTVMRLTQMTRILLEERARKASVEY